MSLNQFNLGHSLNVVFTNPLTGASVLTLTNITKFDRRQNTEKLNSKPLNAQPIFVNVPNGWTGTAEFDRMDPTIDNFFAALEAAYWAGAQTYTGQIFEYQLELDMSTSQYRYDGVTLTFDDAGTVTSQGKITLKISWEASQRVLVS